MYFTSKLLKSTSPFVMLLCVPHDPSVDKGQMMMRCVPVSQLCHHAEVLAEEAAGPTRVLTACVSD